MRNRDLGTVRSDIPIKLALDTLSVREHQKDKDLNLIKEAYNSLKGDAWREKFTENATFLEQKSPLNNTVLHIAAKYGKNDAVEYIAQQDPKLLNAKNLYRDTALHFAARVGHISTLQKLLALYFEKLMTDAEQYVQRVYPPFIGDKNDLYIFMFKELIEFMFHKNERGNTFFREALICGQGQVLESPFCIYNEKISLSLQTDFNNFVKSGICIPLVTNNEGKSILDLAIEGGNQKVVSLLLEPSPVTLPMVAISPLFAAIKKRNKDMLSVLLSEKTEWIYLRDGNGRTAIHYAAYIGFLEGVRYLPEKCASCTIATDNEGFYPHHLASHEGHVEIVHELLKTYSLDPTEIVGGKNHENILHTAAANGRLTMVNYILRSPELKGLINQKNANGDTPLHVASFYCRPRIVHALTLDKRVELDLLNKKCQTVLDVMEQSSKENPPLSQRLTWSELQSAGVPRGSEKIAPHEYDTISREEIAFQQGIPRSTEKKPTNMGQYKDRVNTLILVSTLIITATFAASFSVPGGNNDSDPGRGIANMINHRMFHFFIFSTTISMYGAISVTIILMWAQLEDLNLAILALKLAIPLLEVTLGTLCLTFMAGVYLVISKLSGLAFAFLFLSTVFAFMVVLLYTLLFFPSASSNPVIRYISYYPFIILGKLAEKETNAEGNGSVFYRQLPLKARF